MKALVISSLATMVLLSIGMTQSYGNECVSVVSENEINDNRAIRLHLSSKNCTDIYGLYVEVQRNGTIMEVTSVPAGWSYGESAKTAFWTTDSEPITDSNSFGIKLQAKKPYVLHWIALDETWSPVAEGILIG